MEARRTFGGAKGSRQAGIVLIAIVAAALLAVASALIVKSLTSGSAPAAGPSTHAYYVYPVKDFPDRQNNVVTKPGSAGTFHARPGAI